MAQRGLACIDASLRGATPSALRYGPRGLAAALLGAAVWLAAARAHGQADPFAPPVDPADPAAEDEADEAQEETPQERAPVVRPLRRRSIYSVRAIEPTPATQEKIESLIDEVLKAEATFDLDPNESKLVRFKRPVSRYSITDPGLLEVVQFSPTEFELIGGGVGHTTLTLWFGGPDEEQEILRYRIRVAASEELDDLERAEYGDLENRINELFPNSFVQLIPVLDKLIVRGQARDSEEASQILAMLSGQATDQTGRLLGPGAVVSGGPVAQDPDMAVQGVQARNLINLMDVPGEQQIMLKVRVAELSRASARAMGSDLFINSGDFSLESIFGGGVGPFRAVLSTDEVTLALSALSTNSFSKVLAEPNLMTINGRPASFVAGGQFAVPTVVGIGGVGAATTSFQSFGTQLSFTPTIIDKDRIRLTVVPTLSSINRANTVDGIPGLNTRTVSTTVDLREGQWLAIAGLIEDTQAGNELRTPFLADLPGLGLFFSARETNRAETELIILVSPELVHPMEPEEVPCVLPGMEVTEPDDWAFFICGRYEGQPGRHYRSSVWPLQQERIYDAHREAARQARLTPKHQYAEEYFIQGSVGFSH